ncbi:MAG: phytanoyl-CoA dioxygenase family protein [Bacteroidetes bacterium]|nr:phytanoyl-CoA dioxygenase family protein [Bacteroidota bacterium]
MLVENIRTQTFNILTQYWTEMLILQLHLVNHIKVLTDPLLEVEFYSMSMWISLTDMNAQNGCLHIIPGSHLWGNLCRNINYTWAFNDYNDKLWVLIPIPLKEI